MSKYKKFTDEELNCPCCLRDNINDDFMTIIEVIREELGLPMVVESGFRCPDYNKIIGGSKGSWHMSGRAIDIRRPSGAYTWKVVRLAQKHGIRGIEVGTNHIHLDNGERVEPIIWTGKSV